MKSHHLLLSCLLMVIPGMLQAFEVPAGVKVLSAPEVKELLKKGDRLLIHTLSRIEFELQHIPGSINIPVNELAESDKMPKDKSASVIFYCNGLACPYSRRASEKAVADGYSNVFWFRGGILEWRKFRYPMFVDPEYKKIKVRKLSPDDFLAAITDDAIVLDVRPKWWRQTKVKAGYISQTNTLIPLLDLDNRYKELPLNRPILIIDRLMRQAPHAAKYLSKKGYNIIGVLKGGTKRWVNEKRAVLSHEKSLKLEQKEY